MHSDHALVHEKFSLSPDQTTYTKTLVAVEGTASAIRHQREVDLLRNIKGTHPNLIDIVGLTFTKKMAKIPEYNIQGYQPILNERAICIIQIKMPYYKNGTLKEFLQSHHPPLLHRIKLFRQILEGIRHLHLGGFVHGSIKPNNIVLDDDGNVKIIDFGHCEPIGINNITPLDDLQFKQRPCLNETTKLYHYFRCFDHGAANEDTIGLIALTKHLFTEKFICHALLTLILDCLHNNKIDYIHLLLSHSILKLPIHEQLASVYTPRALALQVKKRDILDELVQSTPKKTLNELTKTPLLKRPPKGFQQLHIEFALFKPKEVARQQFQFNLVFLLNHFEKHPRTIQLEEAAQLAKEAYLLAQHNRHYQKNAPHSASIPHDTLFFKKFSEWATSIIYGNEIPADLLATTTPRAYLATHPMTARKMKVVIVFVGAETMPTPLESWWTNDREYQDEIWEKVNFNRSGTRHDGLITYANYIIKMIEQALQEVEKTYPSCQFHFELIGHSTGGVLAIKTARYLKKRSSQSHIHMIGFGTPNFMTQSECDEFAKEFKNDSQHSCFNMSVLDDPSISIYGEHLVQPKHTVFIKPLNDSGLSFINVYAASKGTTRQNIKNHSIKNYQALLEHVTKKPSLRSKL